MGCAQSSGEDGKPGQVAVQQWNPPPKSTRPPLLKLALPSVETSASAAGAGDAATGATDVDGIVGRTPPAVRPRSFGEVGEVQLTSGVLDVGAGTLAVYVNGRRLGTMVQPGMQGIAPLRPPLRWAVTVRGEVAIDGPQPLPPG